MRTGREVVLIVAVCAALFLPGLARTPFYTRGEPREGLVVRVMLESGEWVVPERPQGELARKPPLYYWLAAPALAALGSTPELALRLPSAALATLGVMTTWWATRAVGGPAAGLPAALVLASSFEWARAATSARVDMTLAAMLTIVLGAWVARLAGRAGPTSGGALIGAALATLAKGPVGLVLPALAAAGVAATERDFEAIRRLRAVRSLVAATALAAVWYLIAFAREGQAFLAVVVRENLLRFVDAEGGRAGHAHSVGYLLGLGLVGLLPWSPLLPLTIRALRHQPRPRPVTLAASWVVTGAIFFTIAAAKRSVYLLPLFPAIALLIGVGAATPPNRDWLDGLIDRSLYCYPVLATAAGVVGLFLAFDVAGSAALLARSPADQVPAAAALLAAARVHAPTLIALGLFSLAAVVPLVAAGRRHDVRRTIVLVAILTAVWIAFFERTLHPALATASSLKSFLGAADALVPADARLYASFPADPGVRFYTPRPLEPWAGSDPSRTRYLLLWEDEWQRLGNRAAMVRLSTSAVTQPGRGHLLLLRADARP